MKNKIKLLIVDDSLLFRSQMQMALNDVAELEIVGAVTNGKLALEKLAAEDIDICILDLEMPVLDGIETLKSIKAHGIKTKVIMFSSQSRLGAERTMDAMRLGAVDFIPKPMPDDSKLPVSAKIREALLPKILSIGLKVPALTPPQAVAKTGRAPVLWDTFRPDVLVIAASTGGPNALVEFFTHLQHTVPFPILITQHMPPIFTASLAERIGAVCGKKSAEAVHGELLKPNQIYVAPGNFHMKVGGTKQNPIALIDQGEHRNYVRPCADYLFETAAQVFGRNTMSIVFTGMGRDGADGARFIKQKDGAVLIQNQETCVVYGMPGAVFEEGHQDFSGSPEEIARKVLLFAKVRGSYNAA